MKSETQINYDFQQAIRKARELENVATGLRSLANSNLTDALQNLSCAWQGEAADAYLRKGALLKERIVENAKKIDSTAKTIRNVAQRTYNAEMEAFRIAKEREYQG